MKGGIDMLVGSINNVPSNEHGYNVVRHRQPGKTRDYLYLNDGDSRVVDVLDIKGNVIRIDKDISNEADR